MGLSKKIDNLGNIFFDETFIKKKTEYFTTSMENYRAKGGKYSYFLKDLTLNLFSIEYIAYSKMSEIIHFIHGY